MISIFKKQKNEHEINEQHLIENLNIIINC